jgi:hypothetical protein
MTWDFLMASAKETCLVHENATAKEIHQIALMDVTSVAQTVTARDSD